MRFHAPLLVLGLVGCKEATAPVDETQLRVQVTASASSYHPLDPAIARITNLSSVTVYQNPCAGQIEGFTSGEWSGNYGSAIMCAQSGHVPDSGFRPIAPGASVEETLHINEQAYAGLWRFQFDIRDADGDLLPLEQRVSEPFEVVR